MTTIFKIPMSKTVPHLFPSDRGHCGRCRGLELQLRPELDRHLPHRRGPDRCPCSTGTCSTSRPSGASVTVADEGILLAAPPFASAVIPWASVVKTFRVDLKKDEDFKFTKTKKYMTFGAYRSGMVEIKDGREAVVVTNRPDVLCVQTEDRYYLVGPSDLPGFLEAVEKAAP